MKDPAQMSAAEIEAELASYESAQAPAPKDPAKMSEDEILAELGHDPDKPGYTNGSSPQAPLNSTFLTPTERFKLKSLGNANGMAKTLAATYGPENVVTFTEGKSKGELRVRNPKTGLWHALDSETFDASDPLEFTKSIVSGAVGTASVVGGLIASLGDKLDGKQQVKNPLEYAAAISDFILPKSMQANAREAVAEVGENAFEIGGLAAGAVALPATAAGIAASGALAGGLSAMRTTLGKAEGTYDAPPEQQALEIGMDTLMGMAGQGLVPGAKFALSKWSSGRTAKAISEMADSLASKGEPNVIDDIATKLAMATGWTERTWQTYLKDGAGVQSIIDDVAREIPQEHANVLAQKTITAAKETAENLVRGADDVWKHNEAELVRLTPKDLKFDLKEMTKPFITAMQEVGVLKALPTEIDKATGAVKGTRGFEFMPFDDFQKAVTQGGKLAEADFAYSRQTYNQLKNLFKDVTTLQDAPSLAGQEGLKNAMSASKILKNITFSMRKAGLDAGSNPMVGRAAQAAKLFDDGFTGVMGGEAEGSLGSAFKALNKNWSEYKSAVEPFEAALQKGDNATLMRLGNAMLSSKPKPGTVNAQFGLHEAQQLLSKVPGAKPKVERLTQLEQQFARLEAVQLINKIEAKPMLSTGGMGVAAMGAMSGSPQVTASVIGAGILTNPRTAKLFLDKSRGMAELVKKAGGKARTDVLLDPRVIKTLLAYPTEAATAHYQTEQMLNEQIKMMQGQGK